MTGVKGKSGGHRKGSGRKKTMTRFSISIEDSIIEKIGSIDETRVEIKKIMRDKYL